MIKSSRDRKLEKKFFLNVDFIPLYQQEIFGHRRREINIIWLPICCAYITRIKWAPAIGIFITWQLQWCKDIICSTLSISCFLGWFCLAGHTAQNEVRITNSCSPGIYYSYMEELAVPSLQLTDIDNKDYLLSFLHFKQSINFMKCFCFVGFILVSCEY